MKNRRNIVEQKYPPENPNDIWLKDGKFYRSTSEGWVVVDSETEYTSKESMIADNPKGGTIGIDKETGEASIYNDVAKQWTPLGGGGGITSITWKELKDKRDAGKLIPGALYRITDYQCTTTQENTQSAGHQFDIVLLALSEDKLAEEGWAMMHENIYDVTFADGVTKKCYIYQKNEITYNMVDINTLLGNADIEFLEIDDVNKTAILDYPFSDGFLDEPNVTYNYFQNSNLSAWKVWYCLDNDKSRFAWADDREGYLISGQSQLGVWDNQLILRAPGWDAGDIYGWEKVGTDVGIFTKTLDINVGQLQIYNSSGVLMGVATVSSAIKVYNGRGIIYRLIDEFNNDVAYDFKNIQFIRKLTNGELDTSNGTNTWVYTFNFYIESVCKDGSIFAQHLGDSDYVYTGVYGNRISSIHSNSYLIDDYEEKKFALSDNVILQTFESNEYDGCFSVDIYEGSYKNTIDAHETALRNVTLKYTRRCTLTYISDCIFINVNKVTYTEKQNDIFIGTKVVTTQNP